MHVHKVPKRAAVAVAESSGSTTLATAVSEAPPVEDSLSAAAGSDEAVAEVPTTMLAQPDELKSADDDEVASHLKEVPLRALIPPAPAAAISCGSGAGDCSGGASTASAVAALHKVEAQLLRLAREIRRPHAYVGYSAFILFGLKKKVQPCVWEGTCHVDLLKVYAPWASELCPVQLHITAIPCALVAQPSGAAELAPICKQFPLHTTRHFVAGIGMEEVEVTGDAYGFDILYASLGIAILICVLDGDCALDVMTMMLGLAPSFEVRKGLRIALSDYLLERIGDPRA